MIRALGPHGRESPHDALTHEQTIEVGLPVFDSGLERDAPDLHSHPKFRAAYHGGRGKRLALPEA